jgi:hypothetical protein
MWKSKIGENAGTIWKALNELGKLNISALKKKTKLDDKHLFFALGWLAKENKISFLEDKRQIVISLLKQN